MRLLEEFKIKRITTFSQLILLDEKAYIVDSCDAIFPTSNLRAQPIFETFPMIESIFEALLQLKLNDSELRFAKVEQPASFLPGYYDFSFSKVFFYGQELILWTIYDFTSLYEDFIQYQQRRNELEIHRQLVESLKQTNVSTKLDAKPLQFVHEDGLRLSYSDSVRDILHSPVNILDGITLSLDGEVSGNRKDYLSNLKLSVKHLEALIAEFEAFIQQFPTSYQNEKKANIALRQMCNNLFSRVLEKYSEQNREFEFELSTELPELVLGFPREFAQILYYMSSNGLKNQQVIYSKVKLDFRKVSPSSGLLNITVTERSQDENSFHLPKQQKEHDPKLSFRLSLLKKLIVILSGNLSSKIDQSNGDLIISSQMPIETAKY